MYLKSRAEKIIESTVQEYGICKGTRGWWVKAPLYDGTEKQNTFKSKNAARQWQLAILRREWGMNRVELIKRGRLCILRKFGCGVTIRSTYSGGNQKYKQIGLFWREHDGQPKSKMFSRKQYGDNAEIEANWFAARKRAELTNSELNLPEGLTPYSFDVN